MKIQSYITKQLYDYSPNGERSVCPECSIDRTKETEKCLTWDKLQSRGYCHHCTTNFYEYIKPKDYICPEWSNKTELSDKAVKWFESRMISQVTLNKMQVYSRQEYMSQFGKKIDVICFPYFSGKKLINIKYRGPEKSFKVVKGAELIFWNVDCLKTAGEVVIVEGEMDALTMIQAGFENTISVPNGAAKNLDYLHPALFHNIKKIFIAVDQDEAGEKLRDKLIEKLGADRCYVVSFNDCKDANEYLLQYGDAIKDVISDAVHIKEKEKFLVTKTMDEWMELAKLQPVPNMLFSELWYERELCILFSFTGYGKSTLAYQIAISISEGNSVPGFKLEAKKQKVLYFDFELSIKQLQGRYSNNYEDTRKFDPNLKRAEIDIMNLPVGVKFEDYLLQQLEELIISSAFKVIVIDNLTCVKGDVEAAKDAIPFMRRLNILKRTYNLSVLVLAHTPKRNESHPLSLNDLSGSSALSKFCDSCFAIGISPIDTNIRYLKQLKEKETECLYGSGNVIICHLEQVENMRQFSFQRYGDETAYLKTVGEEEKKAKEIAVIEAHRQNKSLRQIGEEMGISYGTVKRILDKSKKDEKYPF